MKKRWIGYAVWLASAACRYFFENGTGTRVVLVGSLLFPLISPLRSAFLDPDRITAERPRGFTTVRQFVRREENEESVDHSRTTRIGGAASPKEVTDTVAFAEVKSLSETVTTPAGGEAVPVVKDRLSSTVESPLEPVIVTRTR